MIKKTLKAGILAEYTSKGLNQKGLVSEIARSVKKYSLDILLGPEWLFLPRKSFYSKKEKNNLIAKLVDSTKDKDSLILPGSIMWFDNNHFYNTMPVISKGKLLGEYNKHIDGGSTDRAIERKYEHLAFKNGHSFGIYFWGGLQNRCRDMRRPWGA